MEKTETALILGGLAIVGVLVYLVYETGKGISDAATSGYNAYKQWHQSVFEGPEYGAQGATGPDRGRRRGRRLQPVVEAHLAREGHRFRSARQHRLGAEVHPRARDLAGQQLAADAVRRLQHGHPRTALQQPVGRGQPGDPGSDDDDPTGARTTLHFAHVLKPLRPL